MADCVSTEGPRTRIGHAAYWRVPLRAQWACIVMALLLSQAAFEAHAAPAKKPTTSTTPKPVNHLAPASEMQKTQAAAYASVPTAASEHQIV